MITQLITRSIYQRRLMLRVQLLHDWRTQGFTCDRFAAKENLENLETPDNWLTVRMIGAVRKLNISQEKMSPPI